MNDTTDYYLIRKIKLAVYRMTDIGDQVEIRMVADPEKLISYKILDKTAISEIERVKLTIEGEAKKIGLRVIEDRN